MDPGENDALQFTAKPGTYWLVSAKSTDLISGMWIVVEVNDSLKRAELTVGERIGSDLEGRR